MVLTVDVAAAQLWPRNTSSNVNSGYVPAPSPRSYEARTPSFDYKPPNFEYKPPTYSFDRHPKQK
jgi:hypothetical protein